LWVSCRVQSSIQGLGVVSWSRVILGSLGAGSWGSIRSRVVLRFSGGVVLGNLGVVGWNSVGCGVILRCLGGVVQVGLGDVISGSLGIVAGIGVVLVGLV
jgi:hypothetical protein